MTLITPISVNAYFEIQLNLVYKPELGHLLISSCVQCDVAFASNLKARTALTGIPIAYNPETQEVRVVTLEVEIPTTPANSPNSFRPD